MSHSAWRTSIAGLLVLALCDGRLLAQAPEKGKPPSSARATAIR